MRRSHRTPSLLIISVLAFALAIAFNSNVATSSNVVQGDADCSQDVDVEDVGAVLARAGSLTDELPCEAAANVDCHGGISARDALEILRFVGGMNPQAPEYCTSIGDPLGEVTITIDPSLEPSRETAESMDGGPPPPVEAVVDPNGVQVEFIQGEIIYRPDNENDLQDFLEMHGATIIRDGSASIAGQPGVSATAGVDHGYYLLGLDTPNVDLGGLADNLVDAGIEGTVTFSSEAGARLMALAANDPDGDTQLSGLIHELTEEHPNDTGGYIDGLETNYFQSGSGLDIGVGEAWRYLRYQDIVLAEDSLPGEAVRIAVIDTGFALHQVTGLPLGGNRDYFPYGSKPLQYDAVDDDLTAGGLSFKGDWHGSGSFGVCCAIADNQYGTAGTAGPYVQPVLIRINDHAWVLAEAVRIAQQFNVQVMSMSVGFTCGTFCGWLDGDLGDALVDYAASGGIPVAGAGNNEIDIGGDTHFRPCEYPAVVCVGAIEGLDLTNRYNWGAPVDIWAPYGLWSTVTPASAATDANDVGFDELVLFGGTSSSTPFVAGVVAMMKALNPGLNKNGVISILQDTAHQVSDPEVAHGYINAFKAVMAAKPNQPPIITDVGPPIAKTTYPYYGTSFRVEAVDPELNLNDPEFFDSVLASFSVNGVPLCQTSVLSYKNGHPGYECVAYGDPGTHDVIVTVTDVFGASTSTTIHEVTFINTPPTVEILNPADGATFYATQTIEFDAYVFDPEEPIPFPQNQIVWTSNIDGIIGTGSSIETSLSQGLHTVTIAATDSLGPAPITTTKSLSLNVLSGEGVPSVEITMPADSPTFHGPGELITFIGNATDPEDGPLTGASLEWYSSIDGFLGTGEQITVTLSGGTNCADYRDHVVSLHATDSDLQTVSDEIHVVVAIFC